MDGVSLHPTGCAKKKFSRYTVCLWLQVLLEKTFLEAQLREIERLKEEDGEGAEESPEDSGIRTTQRLTYFLKC